MLIYRFTRAENNWYDLTYNILNGTKKVASEAKAMLTNNLIELIPLFEYKPFLYSDTLGALDACVAPVLWRRLQLDVNLGRNAQAILDYENRVFSTDSFKKSLTNPEKELR